MNHHTLLIVGVVACYLIVLGFFAHYARQNSRGVRRGR